MKSMVASPVPEDVAPSKINDAVMCWISMGTAARPSTVLPGGARSKLVGIAPPFRRSVVSTGADGHDQCLRMPRRTHPGSRLGSHEHCHIAGEIDGEPANVSVRKRIEDKQTICARSADQHAATARHERQRTSGDRHERSLHRVPRADANQSACDAEPHRVGAHGEPTALAWLHTDVYFARAVTKPCIEPRRPPHALAISSGAIDTRHRHGRQQLSGFAKAPAFT